MYILSFDVGIKNLAFCVFDSKTKKICRWENISLDPQKGEDMCLCVVRNMDNYEELLNFIDKVVIEKQPSRNNKMRVIEALLQSYFVIKGLASLESTISKVSIYSAKHKLGNIPSLRGKSNYAERKKLSVQRCKSYIESSNQPFEMKNKFEKSKKKDDLADTLLQALAYIGDPILETQQTEISNSKISARKPTDKQEKRGYSKNNLKYFYKEYGKEEFKNKFNTNKKIEKALLMYFDNLETALSHLEF
tara:strand:+ start:787 stop:1530 length:744 start_codon:yes stop_codon:yes gene_type:complete